MFNGTVTERPPAFSTNALIGLRSISALVLLENSIVAVCLFTHKKFSKQEFWLLLVCLCLNDILCGIAMMLISFIDADLFKYNLIGCSVLMTFALSSQLSMLYNIFVICLYRFIFVSCFDRLRFGWRAKMSIYQITGAFTASTTYTALPFMVWSNNNHYITGCSGPSVFQNNEWKAFAFIACGFVLPLIIVNILYCVTFVKLRQHLRKRIYFMRRQANYRICSVNEENIVKKQDKQLTKVKNLDISRSRENCVFDMNQINSTQKVAKESCCERFSTNSVPGVMQQEKVLLELPPDEMELNEHKNVSDKYKHTHRGTQLQCLTLIGLILLLINITTWPAVISSVVEATTSFKLPLNLKRLVYWLIFNNALINPWLYSLQSSEFRASLKAGWVRFYYATVNLLGCP